MVGDASPSDATTEMHKLSVWKQHATTSTSTAMPPVEGTETGERVTPSSPNVLLLLAFGSSRCFP